jgi:hypothetical protein
MRHIRNKFIVCMGLLLLLLGLVLPARAQFSVMGAATLAKPMGAPKDYPSLLGFSPRITMDISDKHQVGIYSGFSFPVTFRDGAVIPNKAEASKGLGVLEFSTMYSYFFWNNNFSDLAAYGSAGPGILYYNTNFTTITSGLPHKCADVVLDLRAGAQAHITIGWLFLEGRLAPRAFSINHETEEKHYGPLAGVNLGMRFLLNRHPLCTN